MTSPFKSKAKGESECNNCGDYFEYVLTGGDGRICFDCREKLDKPENCSFEVSHNFNLESECLEIRITVSHEEPTTVYIPSYDVRRAEDNGKGNLYIGKICRVSVRTLNGAVLDGGIWEYESHYTSDANLNINHDKVLGCDGSREWIFETDIHTDVDEIEVEVRFPSIEDSVPESHCEMKIGIPDIEDSF